MDFQSFDQIVVYWAIFAILLLPWQLFITAPYGRHRSNHWGPTLPNRLGWVVMELVSPIVFAYFFLVGENIKTLPMCVFFFLWMAHYFHRSLIFPFKIRTHGKDIPMLIVVMGMLFNSMNGYLNGYYLGTIGSVYPSAWIYDQRMFLGVGLFALGAWINITSDYTLIRLRKENDKNYSIPHGGFFRWISCPNHLGEMMEWLGFAIMCWNPAALSFAIWTIANLLPRAISHHKWYKAHFPSYPKDRRALIPFIL